MTKARLFWFICIAVVVYPATSENKFEKINERTRELILSQGFLVKNYTVETEDGYLLDLLRMPYYRDSYTEDFIKNYVGTEKLELEFVTEVYKQAVVLVPGLMSSFEEFVAGGVTKGLAFHLASYGYDVYLANVRGSKYARRHKTLDADKDAEYWNYTLNDIAVKDIPAILDKISTINRQLTKTAYIGHMEGTTLFYIMTSERPEYNDKLDRMIALGPVVHLNNTQHAIIKKIADMVTEKVSNSIESDIDIWNSDWIKEKVGATIFKPSDEITAVADTECGQTSLYFLMNGCNSKDYEESMVNQLSTSDVSAKQILQYVQMYMSGTFRKFDENFVPGASNEEGVYDLSKMTTPVIALYTPHDVWSHVDDVQTLLDELSYLVIGKNIHQFTNNMDLLFHRRSRGLLQPYVRISLVQRIDRP